MALSLLEVFVFTVYLHKISKVKPKIYSKLSFINSLFIKSDFLLINLQYPKYLVIETHAKPETKKYKYATKPTKYLATKRKKNF